MNDRLIDERMMDELLRELGRAARTEIEDDVDVDAAWTALSAWPPRTRNAPQVAPASPRRVWWFAAAAAAGIAIVGGIVLLRDDGDSIQTAVPITTATDEQATDTVPTSEAPAVTPSSEPNPVPTTAPVAVDPSPPTDGRIAVSAAEPPPELSLTPLAEVDIDLGGARPDVAIGEVGIVVNHSNDGFVTVVGFDSSVRRVDIVDGELPDGGLSQIVYGPGDVLYGLHPTSAPIDFVMAAIPLSGESEGRVVARSESLGSATWVELPTSPFGHGADGVIARTREVGATLMPYVDERGEPRQYEGLIPPFATITDELLVTSEVGWEWQLDIERTGDGGAPLTGPEVPAPGSGLRVVYATDLVNGGDESTDELPVIAVLEGEGTVTGQWWSLPAGWQYVASDLWGTVFARVDAERGTMEVATLAGGPQTWRKFASQDASIERKCVDAGQCTQLGVSPTGTMVSYDPVEHAISTHATPKVTINLPENYTNLWIQAIGPGDIAYLGVASDSGELAADLVAVSTSSAAFREIDRWSGVVGYTDGEHVVGPDGLIDVGCCGEAPERPSPDDELDVAWVDESGTTVSGGLPQITIRHDASGGSYSIEREGRTWEFEPSTIITARSSSVIGTFDGGVLASFSNAGGGESVVVRGWPDGSVEAVWLDSEVAAINPTGIVLFDNGDRFARARLFEDRAAYANGQVDIDEGGTGAVDATRLNAALAAEAPMWALDPVSFGHAVAGPTQVNERRTIDAVQTSELNWTVTVTTENHFDDSVHGTRLVLELNRADADSSFRLASGQWSNVCQPSRGHQDYSPAFCV